MIIDGFSDLGDLCYLSVFGWVDVDAQKWNKDVIKEDLATLPPQVNIFTSKTSLKLGLVLPLLTH